MRGEEAKGNRYQSLLLSRIFIFTYHIGVDAEESARPAPHTSWRHHHESLTVHAASGATCFLDQIILSPQHHTCLVLSRHPSYATQDLCPSFSDSKVIACHHSVTFGGEDYEVVGYVLFPQHSSFHTSHAYRSATRQPHSLASPNESLSHMD